MTTALYIYITRLLSNQVSHINNVALIEHKVQSWVTKKSALQYL